MNKRKAQRGDGQHNRGNLTRAWRGDRRGKGVGGFGSALHGKAVANLGFHKPLRFDNQTLFCLVLGF
jgi:hypothetical protein